MNRKHGAWRTPEYEALQQAKARCHNAKHKAFALYGARGIFVCDEWRRSFAAFFEHIGPRPANDYSLDRIDNSRGYEPGNVRWTTSAVQNQNKRSVKLEPHEPAQIRWLVSLGYPQKDVAAFFGVGRPLVCQIVKGDVWRES